MLFLKLLLFFFTILTSFYLNSQSVELRNEFKVTSKFYKDKNFIDALRSNDKALELSINEFGKNHLTTATLLENKGRILIKIGKFYDAELILKDAILVRRDLIRENHPDIAEALNYLSLSLRFQDKLQEAILIHNEVLTMMGSIIANNPGQISELTRRSALYRARAYETKGLILLKENNIEDAKGNFRIALKIFERTLEKNKTELNMLKIKLNNLN